MITGDLGDLRETAPARWRRILFQIGKKGAAAWPGLVQGGLSRAFVFALSLRDDGSRGLLGYARMGAEKLLRPRQSLFQRHPENAYRHPDGLIDLGGNLNAARLIAAYAQGAYPWNHASPLKWWSPSKRAVLFFSDIRIEKNLRRVLRQGRFRITFDKDFEGVMRGCASPRDGRVPITWIGTRTITAYRRLYALGHAHSVEVWNARNELVGGLYGVVHGGVFVIESQFAAERDASKAGFVTLARHLKEWGFVLADGKVMTGHLANMGMREISRETYLGLLKGYGDHKGPEVWQTDPALDAVNWKPEELL